MWGRAGPTRLARVGVPRWDSPLPCESPVFFDRCCGRWAGGVQCSPTSARPAGVARPRVARGPSARPVTPAGAELVRPEAVEAIFVA